MYGETSTFDFDFCNELAHGIYIRSNELANDMYIIRFYLAVKS